MPKPGQVERAKVLKATGKTQPAIAKELGVCVRTIGRWLKTEDPPEFAEELERIRSENREKFVSEAWEIIHELNRLMREKIKEEGKSFKPKDIAVCMGVTFDKAQALERPEAKGGSGKGLVINILPPAQLDGNKTTVIADAVPVSDIESEICGDDSGGGGGQDLLALPPGRDDGAGEPGVPRDNSSFNLSEPGRLCDPDADAGAMGTDRGS